MQLLFVVAFLAVAAAVPFSYKPQYESPSYSAPSYSDNKYADITITSQSDERNVDDISWWKKLNFILYNPSITNGISGSDEDATMQGVTYDSYGKESYGEVLGNTNKGSCYWVSPEGEKFTLTWAADEAGFQPKGDHLPVTPVHEYELPVAPVHEYELPVAPVHIPFNSKGYKIY
ncbi:hypothetical protein GHT06_013384 [Daphnia sinensis]|uniref:Uncharacterized protein n=1 Tax=Daphnia sinensis TaxID=1820382 RepID=A0AAD5KX76_9CRUS|nr:hypothetical protein GHT06_005452 [Daphnia sinensis]KAI9562405.1 hypothetical protein GHT06_013375 [Daphnia sinensis]KAI9562414.1 hypothetical protein GHT06_013384 [Daphnia sinensis]